MAAKPIIVGCRLPNGIILEHPADPTKRVTINGLNKIKIIGADYAVTEVDPEFWAAWHSQHKDAFQPLVNGSIFTAGDVASADSVARELSKVKTGLEPVDPADKKNGVESANNVDPK